MTTSTADTGRDTKPAKPLRDAAISPDGKWRSFPKVPNLVQYVSTGSYFGRVKIDGKIFRGSLDTDVFTTAKLLLGDGSLLGIFTGKQRFPSLSGNLTQLLSCPAIITRQALLYDNQPQAR